MLQHLDSHQTRCLIADGANSEYCNVQIQEWDYAKSVYRTEKVYGLADLIALLPKEMSKNGIPYSLEIRWVFGLWMVRYVALGDEVLQETLEPELINALYLLYGWFLRHR